ncbi:MAG TPA: alpha/beta fold hydrolase [Thermomonospora sp.]|nr:alpha/beta fold hydrolase [Thermomonospora sp.]
MTPVSMEPDAWIRSFGPAADDTPPLVCLPYAGGAASVYHPLAQRLAPRTRVLAVQYPGRQERYREPTIEDLGELADRVFEVVTAAVPGPLALFGHSMGALVAYEVALRMRRAGLPGPLRLFASARRAPSRYRFENVHRRGEDEIVAVLRALGGPHAGLLDDPEMRALVLPSVRGDYRATETYRHDPDGMLDRPVTVLTGDADPLVTPEEAADWRRHTTGPVDVRTFPGGHFFLLDHTASIAALVGEAMEAAATPG